MNKATVTTCLLFLLLAGCARQESSDSIEGGLPGSDKDKYGCIGSAGYSWCARTAQCERPWELSEQIGFSNTSRDFEEYCGEQPL